MESVPDITGLTELVRVTRYSGSSQAELSHEATSALEALCHALSSPDHLTQVRAADALGRVGDPTCVPALVDALLDPDEIVREAAAHALGKIGCDEGATPLLAIRDDPDPRVRVAVISALGRLGGPGCASLMLQFLESPEMAIVAAAATALGRLKDRQAVAPLCRALLRSSRYLPDFMYGRSGEQELLPEEQELLGNQDLALLAIVRALAEIGSPEVADTLSELIGEPFWRNVAVAAAEALEMLLPALSPAQLTTAIGVLKNQIPPWSFEPRERREIFRRVLVAARGRHQELARLPLPSVARPDLEQLPRPVHAAFQDAGAHPIPSDPLRGDLGEH